MKRSLTLMVVYLLLGITTCTAAQQSSAGASQQSPRKVATALEHLTVLEYDEPVAQAAVGSAAFQVEWRENKVFIKPLKAEASTNLFVWTASAQQFSYELGVADVPSMDAIIHITTFKLAPVPDTSARVEQSAAIAVTRALLGMEPIDSGGFKTPKHGIGVRIEGVFRDNGALFIRYSLENHTAKAYRVSTPSLFELRTESPDISLASLKDKQLDQRTIEKLGETKEVSVPCTHDSDQVDVAPGARKQGLIAVHQAAAWPSPMVVQVVFGAKVKATMVL